MPLIKARAGKNLSTVLSKSLVTDWYAALSDLTINEYDEDAENVWIIVKPDRLVIEGDGGGMDIEGLRNFFRQGDSVKLQNPFSPRKHRRRIGKFGIAKVLLNYLGRHYLVETVKNEVLYRADSSKIDAGRQTIKIFDEPAKGRKNGTRITITDLNFQVGTKPGDFSVADLMKRFTWDRPLVPDYNISINDSPVPKRDLSKGARTYEVDARVMGNVLTGRLYWSKTPKEGDGVRIYVNKRPVGDPEMFDLRSIGFNLENRVLGVVDADFLEESITLDKNDLQEGPLLHGAIAAIEEILHAIKKDVQYGRAKQAKEGDKRIAAMIEGALSDAGAQLSRRLGREYRLEFSEKAGSVSSVDRDRVYINPENKMFSLLATEKVIALERSHEFLSGQFQLAAAMAMANLPEKVMRAISRESNEMLGFFENRGKAAGFYLKTRKIEDIDNVWLCEHRLYDADELSSAIGRHPGVVKLLFSSGALCGTADFLFRKRDIVPVLRKLDGHVSCVELTDPRFSPDADTYIRIDSGYSPSSVDCFLAGSPSHAGRLNAKNIGKKGPFYFIPESSKKDLIELAGSGVLRSQ